MTEDTPLPSDFPAAQRKKVTVDFADGSISSEGGLVLLRGGTLPRPRITSPPLPPHISSPPEVPLMVSFPGVPAGIFVSPVYRDPWGSTGPFSRCWSVARTCQDGGTGLLADRIHRSLLAAKKLVLYNLTGMIGTNAVNSGEISYLCAGPPSYPASIAIQV